MISVMTKNKSSVINQRWSTRIASVITPDGIYIKSYTPSSEEEDRIAQIYNELSNMINKQNDNLQSQIISLKEGITKTFTNDGDSLIIEDKYNIIMDVDLKAKNEYVISLSCEKNVKINCVYSNILYSDGTNDENVLNALSAGNISITPKKDIKNINIVILKNENSTYLLNIKRTGIVNSETKWYKTNLAKSNLIKELRVEKDYVENKLKIGRIEYSSSEKDLIVTILNSDSKQLYFLEAKTNDDDIVFNTKYGFGYLKLSLNNSFYYDIDLQFDKKMIYEKNQIIDYIQPEYYYNKMDFSSGFIKNSISNKNSSDATKDLLNKLYKYSNDGYTFYGQEEDYVRGIKNGEAWEAPDTAYAYQESGIWKPKDINDIVLTDYSNVYSITNNVQGKVLALDIHKVIDDYINSKTNGVENNELNKAKIIGLVRKFSEDNNGLITFCSHMNNPYGGLWDEINPVHPDAFKCILDESDGGVAKAWFDNFLDCCVDLFNSLTDKNNNTIPILFRPFHERFSLTFWWNNSTAEEWNFVWIKMVNYINERCDNVLWVYNPCRNPYIKSDLTSHYVGDDYVDIIGTDIYLENNEVNNIYDLKYLLDSNGITDLYNFAKRHGKVCSIPELGSLTIKNYWNDGINILLNRCGIRPAYCTTWYNTSDKIYAPYDSTTDNGQSYISFLNNVCRGNDISLLD